MISLPDVSSCELREAAEFLYGKKLKGNEESLHSGGAVECLRLGGWACNQEEEKSASALGTTTRVRIKEEEISSKPSLPPASDDSYWREMGEEEEEYNYGDDFQVGKFNNLMRRTIAKGSRHIGRLGDEGVK